MLRSRSDEKCFLRSEWIARCEFWKSRFPSHQDSDDLPAEGVNPYYFVEALSSAMNEDDILVVDGGVILDYVMQAFRVKQGQRIISSPGLEYPGFAVPGAIGAYVGSEGRRIVCLCEKRGLKANIPELQIVSNKRIPIVFVVFNSQDDLRVQQVQADYFGCRYVGCDGQGIIGSINVTKLGDAYEIPTEVIAEHAEIQMGIHDSLASEGPLICEVRLAAGQEIVPRVILTVKSDGKWISKPIEDMYPFLDRDVFRDNMIIDVLEEE
jgi:acetolactate synthase-1/2/3 large subunit